MNKYIINPVRATCEYLENKDHGIQEMNDLCFGICTAFSNTNSAYDSDPKCMSDCANLIEQRKHEIFGVGSCDHQVPYRPVSWQQIPRNFPFFLRKGFSPSIAKMKCYQSCEKSSYSEECKNYCDLDFSAVEQYKPSEIKSVTNENTNENTNQSSSNTTNYYLIIVPIIVLIIIGAYAYKKI